jgi:tetratricopeptide (TPR) repeat protein
MGGKYLFKLTLACLLALIGWVNSGWAADVADRCQQLYKNGQYEQAFPVCSKAAKQGVAKAQYNLGVMYGSGEGVQQDDAEAVKWYRKAAEQGDAAAQCFLGMMYGSGKGVQQDYAETVKWLRKAAGQGDADSQFFLGEMYARGEGVMQSVAAAADWYYKAGLSYLKEGRKDDALMCVERIKDLKTASRLTVVPNAFLADKLLTAIYGNKEGQTPITSDAKQRVTVGGKTVVVDSIRVFEDQFELTYNGRILKGPANQLSAVIAAIAIYEQKNNRNQEVPERCESVAEQRKGESQRVSQQTVGDSDYLSQDDVEVKAQYKVDRRIVEFEKRRLEEKIQRCAGFFRLNKDWNKDCADKYKKALKELSDDPAYYFYKKGASDSRKQPLVIDPQTGRVIPGIPLE